MALRVLGHRSLELRAFHVLISEPGRYDHPDQLPALSELPEVAVPSTLAAVLAARGQLDLSHPPELDGQDVWFCARLPAELPQGARQLSFDGLATLADVWLDGRHLLRAENMFRRYQVDAGQLRPGSLLALRFASLTKHLAGKRARPRYRTRLVEAQQLRWVRTSLLGRTPGFSPRVPVMGPYRAIHVLADQGVRAVDTRIHTRVVDGRGELELAVTLQVDVAPDQALRGTLQLAGAAGNTRAPLTLERTDSGLRVAGGLTLEQVALWWPHTHGAQPRSQLTAQLELGARLIALDFGQVGFRSVEVERGSDGQGFALRINGQRVFCRGACWTVGDLIGMRDEACMPTLQLVREAGMNMLRVTGTTTYESDAFYEACDALGILVFQDFMFANMDYPAGDPAFVAEVEREVEEQLTRLSGRPCVAVLCGGSEVEQQVAMLGLGPELANPQLFAQLLPEWCARLRPDVPYVSNSPSGGALPFSADSGITHYYGVGAYLRPLSDLRASRVRFAAECLAFANVPSARAVEALLADLEMPFHHPRWKERVPRDRGASWDFEDVRDHYLEQLYQQDARRLRYSDPERYLALSRAVVVELMEQTLAELRVTAASDQGCGGALVYWLKDLWLGAGWGVIDAQGEPKSAYYGLKRVLAPRALLWTDEGMNGPYLHVVNDSSEPLPAQLSVALYRDGRTLVSEGHQQLSVAPHGQHGVAADALFPRFVDPAYRYRFGPPNHDLLVASLCDAQGTPWAQTFFLPLGLSLPRAELGLSASFEQRAGQLGVQLSSEAFAQRVELEVDGHLPLDNYFHLAPHSQRWVPLRPLTESLPARLSGRVNALNALAHLHLTATASSHAAARS